ncbi:Alpha-(1-3)-fucosyltransferase 6-like [Brachionus plicatilis]|uniref:Fucosyltransferase n=1 Tax=Brachionus plicatilis TaxID=10195 RepID=A0A3M7SDA3_BRAPC|nr:Alpha-(1-3)-fucosyltransferase 6-like [Brachionus plicatilis]
MYVIIIRCQKSKDKLKNIKDHSRYESYLLLPKLCGTFIVKQKSNHHLFKKNYYSQMTNLYDSDLNSVQFNLYLKFKQNPKSKKKLAPILAKKRQMYYLILEYTRIFGKKKFCEQKISDEQMLAIDDQKLLSKLKSEKTSNARYTLMDKCLYKNCFFSCDKSLAMQSDALLFHTTDLGHENSENLNSHLFDFERNPAQIWLLWNDEANHVSNKIDSLRFNWTISYNSMSEASFCTYGCLTETDATIDQLKFENFVSDEFKKRQNTILWMVSNCGAKARLKIVEKLALYNKIEIHGKCVHLIEFKDEKCPRNSECEKNSLSRNYITEKFWRSLDFNLIPIVFQPNKEHYERIAPANSFIHLADFGYDSKKLSDYLNLVSEDLNLYAKYFEWKKYYKAAYQGDVFYLEIKSIKEMISDDLSRKTNFTEFTF